MKFGKNLQRLAGISNPEWLVYWPSYKTLKKMIKDLPNRVPSDVYDQYYPRYSIYVATGEAVGAAEGDTAAEERGLCASKSRPSLSWPNEISIQDSPKEKEFFRMLHRENRKACHFFDNALKEFTIREVRVRAAKDIIFQEPNNKHRQEKLPLLAKSLFTLHRELLFLESFAVMTYCAFSKILKKHDKVTGYNTRKAFMENVVNKANYTTYPTLVEMIERCEHIYEQVSHHLASGGKQKLYEDERLFIDMIHKLNATCMDAVDYSKPAPMERRRQQQQQYQQQQQALWHRRPQSQYGPKTHPSPKTALAAAVPAAAPATTAIRTTTAKRTGASIDASSFTASYQFSQVRSILHDFSVMAGGSVAASHPHNHRPVGGGAAVISSEDQYTGGEEYDASDEEAGGVKRPSANTNNNSSSKRQRGH